jgi:hypothetical protein
VPTGRGRPQSSSLGIVVAFNDATLDFAQCCCAMADFYGIEIQTSAVGLLAGVAEFQNLGEFVVQKG